MVKGKEERQKESKRQALRLLQQFCRRYRDMNTVHKRRKFESGVKRKDPVTDKRGQYSGAVK